ncbi:MAG: bifunctional DNA primase/polymerase [Umezawaea sp.]
MSDHAATARLAEALIAADRGWHVFPVIANSKRPAITDWENRATADPASIRRFWTRYPTYNVGVATGPSNLVVVDLDVAKSGQVAPDGFNMLGVSEGADVLSVLAQRAHATIPATYTVRTPSGGTHLYYRVSTGVRLRNTAGTLGWLIDTRAHGGYVVASGSVLPTGAYELMVESYPAILPTWMVQALTARPSPVVSATNHSAPAQRGKYLDAILQGELRKVAAAQPGRHNKTLFQAALSLGQLVEGGELDHAESTAMLQHSAAHMVTGTCQCTARQIADTIASGLRLGATRPRRLDNGGGVAA